MSDGEMKRTQMNYRETEDKTISKSRIRLINATSVILISIGIISLLLSVIFSAQILAFIGLGLFFWGAILLYIRPEEYTKKVLLDAAMPLSFEILTQILNELDYKGKAIYLPPKYLKDPEANKVYISKLQNGQPPNPDQIVTEESKLFIKKEKAILFTPPGDQLAKLFGKRLGINFTKVNLQYIKENLPRIFIDDLGIVENLEIIIRPEKFEIEKKVTSYSKIQATITNSIFKNLEKENPKISQIYNTIGSPLSSAIACILTKVTGKSVIIEKIQSYEDGKTIEVTYKIEKLEYIESTEKRISRGIESRALIRSNILPKLLSLNVTLLGSIILIWISWIIFNDITTWQKTLYVILFGSRVEQSISLGIDMKAIYYLLIGIALIFSGAFNYLRISKIR